MATQIVTFPADSGIAITPQRPDVRLVIPNDGAVYDLSQSRVRVTMSTNEQQSAKYPAQNVIDRKLRFNASTPNTFPVGRESFVRHVKITDQKHGVVDLRRFNNTLMSTLNEYQRSRTEKITSGVFDTYSGMIDNVEAGGFFLRKHVYDGPEGSFARDGVVDIPLSDLTDLARVGESRLWPTSFTGETVIELEMEPNTSFVADPVAVNASRRTIQIQAVGGGQAPIGTTQYETVDLVDVDANPFYVDMPVIINVGNNVSNNTIISIKRNENRLTFLMSAPSTTALASPLTLRQYDVSATPATGLGAAAVALNYVRVELQMVRVMSGGIPRSLSYMSYRLRDLSQSTTTEFTTTLQVPSDRTPNVIVMYKSPNTIQSTEPGATQYRFSINDEYEAPAIAFRTSQHQEMIVRGFRNAGMTLRDLSELLPSSVDVNQFDANNAASLLKVIMAPLPLRPPGEPETVVQLEIVYATAGARRLLVYAQQISTLQLQQIGVDSGTGPAF